MPAWAIRPVLPSGASFTGQIVHNMTNVTIPNTLKRYVDSVTISESDAYLNKYTGFETKKYRIGNATGATVDASLSIMLVGDLPRWLMGLFESLARGCNGAGMELEFYDDWISSTQYTGRWVNAADFVDNSELLCGGSIDLAVFDMQATS